MFFNFSNIRIIIKIVFFYKIIYRKTRGFVTKIPIIYIIYGNKTLFVNSPNIIITETVNFTIRTSQIFIKNSGMFSICYDLTLMKNFIIWFILIILKFIFNLFKPFIIFYIYCFISLNHTMNVF